MATGLELNVVVCNCVCVHVIVYVCMYMCVCVYVSTFRNETSFMVNIVDSSSFAEGSVHRNLKMVCSDALRPEHT